MNELLEKINTVLDDSIINSTDETALQLRILKGNINTLFKEAMDKEETFVSTVVETPQYHTEVNKKKIIVVDDSSIIRNYLQRACATKYDVTTVSGGSEAISHLGDNHYDLILLDLMMPGVDGFGVLDYLKNNNNNIPVVIISGDTTKETIDRAFQYNVVDMIEKPFSEKTIIEKIDRILE